MGVGICLKLAKIMLRILGALVSCLFAAQGIYVFCNPQTRDFWQGCHWVGQGLLGVIVGACGCYMEVKGSMASVAKSLARFALNRIALSIFYFWLGCYVMGGSAVVKSGEMWQMLAHGTGILSWIVAGGDLLVSCCSEAAPDDEAGLVAASSKEAAQEPSQYGKPKAAGGMSGGSPFADVQADDAEAGDLKEITLQEEPAYSWNSSSKPFGLS